MSFQLGLTGVAPRGLILTVPIAAAVVAVINQINNDILKAAPGRISIFDNFLIPNFHYLATLWTLKFHKLDTSRKLTSAAGLAAAFSW
jgi:hypothetical protein